VLPALLVVLNALLTPSQESFYSKLKKFADETNTNLYVSNIPKNMNEHVSHHHRRSYHLNKADNI